MSAKTVKGLLRKNQWTAEEIGVACLLDWIYLQTQGDEGERPFSSQIIDDHYANLDIRSSDMRLFANYICMIEFFRLTLPYVDFHKSRAKGSTKCVFLIVKNLLAYESLEKYMGELKPGATLPEPILALSLNGYMENNAQYSSNASFITEEYTKIIKSCFFLNGFNKLIDDLAIDYGIRDISLLKCSTAYIQETLNALNKVIESLHRFVYNHSAKEKIAVFDKFIHPVLWEKTLPKTEKVNDGRMLLKDFSTIIKDRTQLMQAYCMI